MTKYFLSLVLLIFTLPSYAIDADDQAPSIPLKQLEGNIISKITEVNTYKGKLIYLDFWASWCGPCRQSFPFLNKIRNQYSSQGFEVIAVNVDTELADARKFLKNFPVDYPILLDPEGKMPIAYDIRGLPTAFIIDRQGTVVYKHLGFKERDKKWITALIEQNLEDN